MSGIRLKGRDMGSHCRKFFVASLAAALLLAGGCGGNPSPADDHEHGHEPDSGEMMQGPHGGRLLEDGDFALEITMFERGVPPEFHVYPSRRGQPVNAAEVQLDIELTRLGGVVERIAFQPQEDFLRSRQAIAEPHSYTLKATAKAGGKTHTWSYESFEGRTSIAPEMAKGAGVETAVAGPGRIEEQLVLFGSIQPDPDRVRNVSARFPGVVRTVQANVGDRVGKGRQLGSVESNESLQTYDIVAPIAGVVTAQYANPGETTNGEPIFELVDFSVVRAELNVFPRDRGRLRPGQPVRVKAADGAQEATGRVDFIAPAGSAGNQALLVRVTLDNADGRWTPGQFIEGRVAVSAIDAPLVILRSALQTFRDWEVAFVNVGDVYEFRPLELGRSDAERVEVLGGLQAGDRYVSTNSYLIKADIEKSGASHDH
jgi:cobalt-zinc-cadmium efflux system membrane fusion protein